MAHSPTRYVCGCSRSLTGQQEARNRRDNPKQDPSPNADLHARHGVAEASTASTDESTEPCGAWNCSCQAFSDLFGTKGGVGNFGRAREMAGPRQWWLDRGCTTDPADLSDPGKDSYQLPYHPLSPPPDPQAPSTQLGPAFLIHADDSEVERGLFHRSLNQLQIFSIILGLYAGRDAFPRLGLPATGARFLGTSSAFNGAAGENDITSRIFAAIGSILRKKLGASLQLTGPSQPIPITQVTVLTYHSGRCTDFCWTFVSWTHAEALRIEMLGPPDNSVLQPTAQHVLLINRQGNVNRVIPQAPTLLGLVCARLRGLGHTIGHTTSDRDDLADDGASINDDFAALGLNQPETAYSKTLIITPHGQQAANFMWAPTCAITIEVFPHGAFTAMYGAISISSGHIYGFVYDDTGSSCGTTHPGSHSMYSTRKLGHRERQCVRNQQLNRLNQTLVAELAAQLLPVRARCLRDGFGSLPVPDLSRVEADFERGVAYPTKLLYSFT